MKYTTIIALIGAASATKLYTPDESRETFEEHRAEAAKVVAEQERFEAEKVADVAKRNNTNNAEADALKQHVRAAADANMMGKTPANPKAQQWTGPQFVQIKEDPAPAEPEVTAEAATADAVAAASKPGEVDPLADPPKGEAPLPESGAGPTANSAPGTIAESIEAKANQRIETRNVIQQQK